MFGKQTARQMVESQAPMRIEHVTAVEGVDVDKLRAAHEKNLEKAQIALDRIAKEIERLNGEFEKTSTAIKSFTAALAVLNHNDPVVDEELTRAMQEFEHEMTGDES